MGLLIKGLEIFNNIEDGHKKLIGYNQKIGIVKTVFRNISILWIIQLYHLIYIH